MSAVTTMSSATAELKQEVLSVCFSVQTEGRDPAVGRTEENVERRPSSAALS